LVQHIHDVPETGAGAIALQLVQGASGELHLVPATDGGEGRIAGQHHVVVIDDQNPFGEPGNGGRVQVATLLFLLGFGDIDPATDDVDATAVTRRDGKAA